MSLLTGIPFWRFCHQLCGQSDDIESAGNVDINEIFEVFKSLRFSHFKVVYLESVGHSGAVHYSVQPSVTIRINTKI